MELTTCRKISKNKGIIACYGSKKSKVNYVKVQEISENKLVNKLKELTPKDIKKMLLEGDMQSGEIIDLLEKRANNGKYISDNNEEFKYIDKSVFPMPTLDNERETIYIYGVSGSGKSWFTKEYSKLYKKHNPDNDIFLFSHVVDDPSFADMEFKQIKISVEILDQIDLKSFSNSLIIFDDTNCPADKILNNKLDGFKNDVAERGRHEHISAIYTTHLACNFGRTRILLAECSKFVIFPGSGGSKQQERMVCEYGGLDKKEFANLKKLRSRWVMFNVANPNYIIYQSGVKLLC